MGRLEYIYIYIKNIFLGVMKRVAACNIDTELNGYQYYIGQANSLSGTKPELFSGGNRTKCIVICYSKEIDSYASGYQEFYCYNRSEGGAVSRRYYRTYNGSTKTWNDWQRIYDNGMLNDNYDLSPLANALGSSGNIQQSVTADQVIDLGEKVYYIVITAGSSTTIPAVIASNGTSFVILSTESHIQVGGTEPTSSSSVLWWVYLEDGHVKVKNKRTTASTLTLFYAFSGR